MATIKSYTDLSQSKKLAEILPLESADMHYALSEDESIKMVNIGKPQGFFDKTQVAWSLAALLNVIPKRIKEYNILRIDIGEKDFAIWYDEVGFGVNNDLTDITADNPVDACYEMIIRLHEQNLL